MKPSDFYTRAVASEGQKMFLKNPDGTTSSEFYLVVRSTDCNEYRIARDIATRAAMDMAKIDDQQVRIAELNNHSLNILTSLVAGWNLEGEFTPAAAREFLNESPLNADLVDVFSAKRANFFAKKQPA